MSYLIPYRGPQAGFKGGGIERNVRLNSIRTEKINLLPAIKSTDLPPPVLAGDGGGMAYDIVTNRPYYSNGKTWLPIAQGGSGSGISYGFIKNVDQVVLPNTNTIVGLWEATSSDVYHTIPTWNLSSGLYTATASETISLEVNLSWKANVSNLGNRILRVQYLPSGGVWDTIKQVKTQVDADISVETTQECQIHAKLLPGDNVRVTVEHDAPIPVSVLGGNHTSISGLQIFN